ncbi:alanine/glycine:cation symporter family protein [Papillibacter cinnamivorans]|uniref:Alanine or glycine:cation symporter, AGCS family n=1 Tax=Papillibacter cinnamivorans DSM 12816 TaxID=1122930 RepID=A0A1W1Z0X4_9FIRM|nr:sodium:alanine symporter family protein [Papillibacter cinnamivorans]SMC42079.1 alanine or glycine:cation symporter, AGCS family [Papillibacter cinnamivorans DSM 12816]
MEFAEKLNDIVSSLAWGPGTLAFFLLLGIYLTVRMKWFQVRHCPLWLRTTLFSMFSRAEVRKSRDKNMLSRFQALTTALAATIGTGSVAGIATAIFFGGPGAVFWMWVSAFFGMMIGFTEKTLGVLYRYRGKDGSWIGGAMIYMERGLHSRWLGMLFSLFCVMASFCSGNMAQANSIATALHSALGWDRLIAGIAVSALLGLVILGGLKRIASVSERLVPFMAGFFIVGGLAVIAANGENLVPALAEIFHSAFAPRAAGGGMMGYTLSQAMRYGIARGVFSNEAGLGSSVMIHSASDVKEPAEQGMWGILEIFLDTMVVCTITALVILTSGVYDQGAALTELATRAADAGYRMDEAMLGAPLAVAAFSTLFGRWGGAFVAISIALFAFSSLLCWAYYGERGLAYLTGTGRFSGIYKVLFAAAALAGSMADLAAVWAVSDTFNALMLLPNLAAIALLSPKAIRAAGEYLRGRESAAAGGKKHRKRAP